MMIIEEVGALIMWLAVFIGWLIKGCKTNLFKECAKIEIMLSATLAEVLKLLSPYATLVNNSDEIVYELFTSVA